MGERIERTGPVDKLTPRVERFLVEALHGIALDDIQSPEATRIDYACLRGLVAVELKTLAGAPSERTDHFVDTLRSREDFPTFFGAVPLDAAFRNMDDPDTLRRKLLERLGRTIVTHMKKANDQLTRHAADYPRRNRLNLLVMVNEDHAEYDPETIGWIVQREMARETAAGYRYDAIDAVLYFTERHGKAIDGRMAFPIASIHGPAIDDHVWKDALLGHVVGAWARWQDRPLHDAGDEEAPGFATIDPIPDRMPRHESWRLAYRRNPYLRDLDEGQLRDAFDEAMLVTILCGFKGSPLNLGMEAMMTATERFTHIQMEMHDRAIPMERFDHRFDRQLAAAGRLLLPGTVIDWLHVLDAERSGGGPAAAGPT